MNEQTMEKMKTMKLHGMVRAFRTSLEAGKADNWTADELVSMLIDSEWDERYNRKLNRNVKNARFRYKAAVEQINFDTARDLNKNYILRLADCVFIDKKEKCSDRRKHWYRQELHRICTRTPSLFTRI